MSFEQLDLAAQQAMARYALWMFLAVVCQTIFSALALWALVKDLRQNRLSSERQLRAYVFLSAVRIADGVDGRVLFIEFKNGGSTPAFNTIVTCTAMDLDGNLLPSPQTANFGSMPPDNPTSRQFGIYRHLLDEAATSGRDLMWEIKWSYQDAFKQTRSGRCILSSERNQLSSGLVGSKDYELN